MKVSVLTTLRQIC